MKTSNKKETYLAIIAGLRQRLFGLRQKVKEQEAVIADFKTRYRDYGSGIIHKESTDNGKDKTIVALNDHINVLKSRLNTQNMESDDLRKEIARLQDVNKLQQENIGKLWTNINERQATVDGFKSREFEKNKFIDDLQAKNTGLLRTIERIGFNVATIVNEVRKNANRLTEEEKRVDTDM